MRQRQTEWTDKETMWTDGHGQRYTHMQGTDMDREGADRQIWPETDMERWTKAWTTTRDIHGQTDTAKETDMERWIWPETDMEMDGQIDRYGQTDIDKVV